MVSLWSPLLQRLLQTPRMDTPASIEQFSQIFSIPSDDTDIPYVCVCVSVRKQGDHWLWLGGAENRSGFYGMNGGQEAYVG